MATQSRPSTRSRERVVVSIANTGWDTRAVPPFAVSDALTGLRSKTLTVRCECGQRLEVLRVTDLVANEKPVGLVVASDRWNPWHVNPDGPFGHQRAANRVVLRCRRRSCGAEHTLRRDRVNAAFVVAGADGRWDVSVRQLAALASRFSVPLSPTG